LIGVLHEEASIQQIKATRLRPVGICTGEEAPPVLNQIDISDLLGSGDDAVIGRRRERH
jgi:hypothetical protein